MRIAASLPYRIPVVASHVTVKLILVLPQRSNVSVPEYEGPEPEPIIALLVFVTETPRMSAFVASNG
jgi:hypothetical protein